MATYIPKKRIGADDVARLAEVSRSAVSRTFTPGASVAPATRARIIAAASSLGYQPVRKQRAAGEGPERLVAVVMANLLSRYLPN